MARKNGNRKNKDNMKSCMLSEISYAINRLSNNFMIVENFIESQPSTPYTVNKSIKEIKTVLEYLHSYIKGKSLHTIVDIHETFLKIVTAIEKKYNLSLTPMLYLPTIPPVYTNPLILEEIITTILENNIENDNLPVFITASLENNTVKCRIKFANSPIIKKIHLDNTMELYLDEDNTIVIECLHYKNTKKDTAINIEKIRNVLIIDDEEEVADVISNILSSIGISYTIYTNGYDALQHLVKNKEKIDIIILDLSMPILDGKEVYKKIKDDNIKIPIILMSGDDLLIEKMEKNISNTDILLKKPFGKTQLEEAIKELERRNDI